jgi:SAM-dependent methyltransferase
VILPGDLILAVAFLKRLLMDQRHIRRSPLRDEIKRLQRNPRIPLFLDRQRELTTFFGLGWRDLISLYASAGSPNSVGFRQHLDSCFAGRTSPGLLKGAYEDAAMLYSMRLMLAFERYSMLVPYMAFLPSGAGPGSAIDVLDYGGGVSDIGLLLAGRGARVTLCDLDDAKLSFAAWRYRVRGFELTTLPVTDPETLPVFPAESYDLIVTTEIFEHLRDPLAALTNVARALRMGGCLFDSMGGVFHRDEQGDHLPEAMAIGTSGEYRSAYGRLFEPVDAGPGRTFLFRRRGGQASCR